MEIDDLAFDCTSPEVVEAAASIKNDMLPEKSKKMYERERDVFEVWCKVCIFKV